MSSASVRAFHKSASVQFQPRKMKRTYDTRREAGGAVSSEFMQAALPYKEFQMGDIVANLFGACLGLYSAESLDRYRRSRQELSRLYLPADGQELVSLEHGLEGQQISRALRLPQRPGAFALEDSDSDSGNEAGMAIVIS